MKPAHALRGYGQERKKGGRYGLSESRTILLATIRNQAKGVSGLPYSEAHTGRSSL